MRDIETIQQELSEVERTLDNNAYKTGTWQRFLNSAQSLTLSERRNILTSVTRVSNKLHRRNRFLEFPAWLGFVFEGGLFFAA
jgi:hypothetical protein